MDRMNQGLWRLVSFYICFESICLFVDGSRTSMKIGYKSVSFQKIEYGHTFFDGGN